MEDRAAEAAKARAASKSLMQAKIKALREAKQKQQQQEDQSPSANHPSSNFTLLPPATRSVHGRSQIDTDGSDLRILTWFGVEDDEGERGEGEGTGEEPKQDQESIHRQEGAQRQSISSSFSSITSSNWDKNRYSFSEEDDGTILGHDSIFPAPPPRAPEDESRESTTSSPSTSINASPQTGFQFSPEDSARASVLLDDLERDLILARDGHSSQAPPRSQHSSSLSTSTINSIASTSARREGSFSSSSGRSLGPPSEPLPSLPPIATSKAQKLAKGNRSSRSGSPIGPPPAIGLPPLPSSSSSGSLSSPATGQFSSQPNLDLRRTLRPGSSSSGSGRSSFESSPSGSSSSPSLIAGRRSSSSRSPLATGHSGSKASFNSIEEDEDALESVLGMGESHRSSFESQMTEDVYRTNSKSKENREMTFAPTRTSTSLSSNSSRSSSEASLRPSSPSTSSLSPYSNSNPGLGIGMSEEGEDETEDEKRRKSLMRKSMSSLMNALSDETDRWRTEETGPFGMESETEGNETETETGRHGHDVERNLTLSPARAEKQREREGSTGGSSSNGSGPMLRDNPGRLLTSFTTNSGIYDLYASAAASKSSETISTINTSSPNLNSPFQSSSSPQAIPLNPSNSQTTPIVTVDAADTSSGSDSDSDRDGPRKRRKAKKNKWAFEDQRAAPSRQGSINPMTQHQSSSSRTVPPVPTSNPSDYQYYQFAPDLPPFVPQGMRPKDLTGAGTWQNIVARAAAAGSFSGPSTPASSIRTGALGHGVHRESAQSFQSTHSLQSTQSAGPVSMRKLAADARKRQAEQAQALERQASQYSQLSFSPFELHAHASNATQMVAAFRPGSSQSVYSAASSNNSTNFSPQGLSPEESALYSQGLPAFNVSGHFPSALSGPHFRDSASEFGTITARSSTSTLQGLGIDNSSTSSSPTQPQAPPAKIYAEMAQQTSPTSSPPTSPKGSPSGLEAAEKAPIAVDGETRKSSLSDGEDTEGGESRSKRESRKSTPTPRQPLRRRSTMGQTETAVARQRNSRLSIAYNADDQDDTEPTSWTQLKAPRLSSRKSNIGTSPRAPKFSGPFLVPSKVSASLNGPRSSTASARTVSIYSTASQDEESSGEEDGSEESDLDLGSTLEEVAERSGALDYIGSRGAKRKLKEKTLTSASHVPILGSRPISSLPSRTKISSVNPSRKLHSNHSRQGTNWSSSEGEDGDDDERRNLGEATATEVDESEAEVKPKIRGSTLPSRNRNGPRPSAPAALSSQTSNKSSLRVPNSIISSSSRSGAGNGVANRKNLGLRKAASTANVSTVSWRRSKKVETSRADSPELKFTSQAEGSDDDDWLSKDIDETELSRYEDDDDHPAAIVSAVIVRPKKSASESVGVPEKNLEKQVANLKLTYVSAASPNGLVSSPQEIASFPEISKATSPSSPQLEASSSDRTTVAENETSSQDVISNLLQSSDSSDQPGSLDLDGTPLTILGSSWSRAGGSGRNSTSTNATSNWSEESGKNDSNDGNHSAGMASGESKKGTNLKSQVEEEDNRAGSESHGNSDDEKPSKPKRNTSGISASLDNPHKPMFSKLATPVSRSSLPMASTSSKLPSLSPTLGKKELPTSTFSTAPSKTVPLPSTPSLPSSVSKLKPRGSLSSGLRQPRAKGSRPSLPVSTTPTNTKTSPPSSAVPSSSIRRMKSFGDKGSSSFVPPPNSTLPKFNPTTPASRSSASGSLSGRSSPISSTNPPPSSWSTNQTINHKSSVSSLSNKSSLPRPSGLPTPKKIT